MKEIRFDKETWLKLAKETGKVSCPVDALETKAQELVDHHLATRTTADITAIVKRLFDSQSKLAGTGMFALRQAGGVYFVPVEFDAFLEQVERFLGALSFTMNRIPVPAGTPAGDAAVCRATTTGLQDVIDGLKTDIAAFGTTTREGTLGAMAEKIKLARHKIASYAVYLRDQREDLEAVLTETDEELRRRVALIHEAREAEASADCDHCLSPNVIKEGQKQCKCKTCGKTFEIQWEPCSLC